MEEKDMAVTIKEIEEREKSNGHRIDKIERKQDEISEISNAVSLIRQENGYFKREQERIIADIAEIKRGIADLRGRSGKRWDAVVDKVLLAVIGAIALYVLSRLGF